MLAAIALAAALAGGPDKPVETGGVDMTCGVDRAHLTLWREANGATRSISAEAKPGEMIVVDLTTWTAKASAVSTLSTTQYAFKTVGEPGVKPQSALLDCASRNAQPLKIRTMSFIPG